MSEPAEDIKRCIASRKTGEAESTACQIGSMEKETVDPLWSGMSLGTGMSRAEKNTPKQKPDATED